MVLRNPLTELYESELQYIIFRLDFRKEKMAKKGGASPSLHKVILSSTL